MITLLTFDYYGDDFDQFLLGTHLELFTTSIINTTEDYNQLTLIDIKNLIYPALHQE